jgi:hypothetical protein
VNLIGLSRGITKIARNLEKLDLARADVTLPLLTMNTRAREVAIRWIYGFAKRDLKTWKKTTDAPFTRTIGSAFIVFDKREELDQWFLNERRPNEARISEMRFIVKDVVAVNQYLDSGLARFKGTDVPQLSDILFPKVYL